MTYTTACGAWNKWPKVFTVSAPSYIIAMTELQFKPKNVCQHPFSHVYMVNRIDRLDGLIRVFTLLSLAGHDIQGCKVNLYMSYI